MSGTASKPNAIGGQLATARRGGIDMCDVWRAKEKIGPRATPSMIAKQLGCCVEDVQRLMDPESSRVRPVVVNPTSLVEPQSFRPRREHTARLVGYEDRFRALWNGGAHIEDIASEFDRTFVWVYQTRAKLGLEPRAPTSQRWTPQQDADLRRLYRARQTAKSIALAMGRTVGAVQKRASVLGLASRADAA